MQDTAKAVAAAHSSDVATRNETYKQSERLWKAQEVTLEQRITELATQLQDASVVCAACLIFLNPNDS